METILRKMFFYRQFFAEVLHKYIRGEEEYEEAERFEGFFDLLTQDLSESQLYCLLYSLDALAQGFSEYLAVFLKTHPGFLSTLVSVFDDKRPTLIETQIRDWISHKKGNQDVVETGIPPLIRIANAEDQTEFDAILEGCYVGVKEIEKAQCLIHQTYQRFGTSSFLMTKPRFSFCIRTAREAGEEATVKKESRAFNHYQNAVVTVALYEWLEGVLSVADSQGDNVLHHLCRKINLAVISKLSGISCESLQIINKKGEKPIDCLFEGWLKGKIQKETAWQGVLKLYEKYQVFVHLHSQSLHQVCVDRMRALFSKISDADITLLTLKEVTKEMSCKMKEVLGEDFSSQLFSDQTGLMDAGSVQQDLKNHKTYLGVIKYYCYHADETRFAPNDLICFKALCAERVRIIAEPLLMRKVNLKHNSFKVLASETMAIFNDVPKWPEWIAKMHECVYVHRRLLPALKVGSDESFTKKRMAALQRPPVSLGISTSLWRIVETVLPLPEAPVVSEETPPRVRSRSVSPFFADACVDDVETLPEERALIASCSS